MEWKEPGALAGEPVFVARPGGVDEDDGILLTLVINAMKGHSFLLILEAKSLQEVARTGPFDFTPYGLHGNFYNL